MRSRISILGVIVAVGSCLAPLLLKELDLWPFRKQRENPASVAKLPITAAQMRTEVTAFVQGNPSREAFLAQFGQPYVMPISSQEMRLSYDCSDHILVIVVYETSWNNGFVQIIEFAEPE